MKTTFVGDIHGKWEIVEAALQRDGDIVFVGDFIDSWDRSPEDQFRCFEMLADALDAGKARFIIGNHEASYLFAGKYQCSGWKYEHEQVMRHWNALIGYYFETHILYNPSFLVSHAGLSQQWVEAIPELLTSDGDLNPDVLQDNIDNELLLSAIGRRRGGWDECGGILWCDWDKEFMPIPGITQIVGHTRGRCVRQKGDSFAIDCLDHEEIFLTVEDIE